MSKVLDTSLVYAVLLYLLNFKAYSAGFGIDPSSITSEDHRCDVQHVACNAYKPH